MEANREPSLHERASDYIQAGLSIIPIKRDGTKAPALSEWKPYQTKRATDDELRRWYGQAQHFGLGIVAGVISGNLVVFDFEYRAIFEDWRRKAVAAGLIVIERCPIVETPGKTPEHGGGNHLYVRLDFPAPPGTDLAKRPVAGSPKPDLLIETRGQGHYVVAPGSHADCHPSRKPYALAQGSLSDIPVITQAEYLDLINLAKSFNEMPKVNQELGAKKQMEEDSPLPAKYRNHRAVREYNAQNDEAELLERHGYTLVRKDASGEKYWRKPKSSDPGHHLTSNFDGSGLLINFSTSDSNFEAWFEDHRRCYTKFEALAILDYAGDLDKALAYLVENGFGGSGDSDQEPTGRESQTSRLLSLIEGQQGKHLLLFKTPAGEAYASFTGTGSGLQTEPMNSQAFRTYLRRCYRQRYRNLCGTEAINSVIEYLSGETSKVEPVFVRVAHHNNCIYVDLANEERQVVQITASGWKVISAADSPVKFFRPRGVLPLPVPIHGGNLGLLKKVMNISTNDQYYRVAAFMIGSFVDGPLLVLMIVGEKGTAKTMQAQIIKKTLDPNEADLMRPPDSDRDLGLACRNQYLVAIDNVSSLTASRSDTHCRIATGTANREREMYTNSDEFIYRVRRPQILTSIKDVISRSDLADRKLKLELHPISKGKRKPERKIWQTFEPDLPAILGALYDAVSGALQNLADVDGADLPRMADAAQFILAAEKHLNWPQGTVSSIFADEARNDAEDILEMDGFAMALLNETEKRGGVWQASANEILKALEGQRPQSATDWPSTPKALANRLREIAPDLRTAGFNFFQETGGRRRYSLNYAPEVPKVPEVPQAPTADGLEDGSPIFGSAIPNWSML